MLKVLCIGDLMLDVIAQIPASVRYGEDNSSTITTRSGGAGGNVASWIKAAGGESFVLARVGDDSAGKTLLSDLDLLGVEYSQTVMPKSPSGVVIVLVDPDGQRTMFPQTGANAGLSIKDLPSLEGFGALYLSGYALLNEESRPAVLKMIEAVNEKGLPIFFDPTTIASMTRVNIAIMRDWLARMSTVIMNEEEALFLSGASTVEDALATLLRHSHNVVIKRGALGAIGQNRLGVAISKAALDTSVVDTTGAGDSFAGGFIAAWMQNPDLDSCIEAGIATAAQCVAIVGARPQVTPNK